MDRGRPARAVRDDPGGRAGGDGGVGGRRGLTTPPRPPALDETLVVGAHRVLLRRDPSDTERRDWVSRLQQGTPLETMLATLLGTDEFMVRYEELRRRAGLTADERERLAISRRLAALEERVEALTRAEESRGGR